MSLACDPIAFLRWRAAPTPLTPIEQSFARWLDDAPDFRHAWLRCPRADWLLVLLGVLDGPTDPAGTSLTPEGRHRLGRAALMCVEYGLETKSDAAQELYLRGLGADGLVLREAKADLNRWAASASAAGDLAADCARVDAVLRSLEASARKRPAGDPHHAVLDVARMLRATLGIAVPQYTRAATRGRAATVVVPRDALHPEEVARLAARVGGAEDPASMDYFEAQRTMANWIRDAVDFYREDLDARFDRRCVLLRALQERPPGSAPPVPATESAQAAFAALGDDPALADALARTPLTDAAFTALFATYARADGLLRLVAWALGPDVTRLDTRVRLVDAALAVVQFVRVRMTVDAQRLVETGGDWSQLPPPFEWERWLNEFALGRSAPAALQLQAEKIGTWSRTIASATRAWAKPPPGAPEAAAFGELLAEVARLGVEGHRPERVAEVAPGVLGIADDARYVHFQQQLAPAVRGVLFRDFAPARLAAYALARVGGAAFAAPAPPVAESTPPFVGAPPAARPARRAKVAKPAAPVDPRQSTLTFKNPRRARANPPTVRAVQRRIAALPRAQRASNSRCVKLWQTTDEPLVRVPSRLTRAELDAINTIFGLPHGAGLGFGGDVAEALRVARASGQPQVRWGYARLVWSPARAQWEVFVAPKQTRPTVSADGRRWTHFVA